MRHTDDIAPLIRERIRALHAERAHDARLALLPPAPRPALPRLLGRVLIRLGHWLSGEPARSPMPVAPGAPRPVT